MTTTIECKPFKTILEQIELLSSRGLIIDDADKAAERLLNTNYYRLSAYSLTLRKDDVFYNNVHFEDICTLHDFDEKFRMIVFHYASFVELTFRSLISYHHAQKYGPLGYRNSDNFNDEKNHVNNIQSIDKGIRRASDQAIQHHKEVLSPYLGYDYPAGIPLWVAVEEMSFDTLSKFYANMKPEDKRLIAHEYYDLGASYIENWLHCTVIARNISAHGGRFYNRPLSYSIKLPGFLQEHMNPKKAFAYIFAIYKLLPTDEMRSALIDDIRDNFKSFPFAKYEHLGFPSKWVETLRSSNSKDTFNAVIYESKEQDK